MMIGERTRRGLEIERDLDRQLDMAHDIHDLRAWMKANLTPILGELLAEAQEQKP
jgi:hypothetical protein